VTRIPSLTGGVVICFFAPVADLLFSVSMRFSPCLVIRIHWFPGSRQPV
jgi:hypothetical protein